MSNQRSFVVLDRLALLVVVACGAPTRPAPTLDVRRQPTGAIHGVVTDAKTRKPLVGVTVIATSTLDHAEAAISDDAGSYTIADLLPGVYVMTFYYADLTIEHPGVLVANGTQLDQQLQLEPEGDIIQVRAVTGPASIIDAQARRSPRCTPSPVVACRVDRSAGN